jgi:hypothetical protein
MCRPYRARILDHSTQGPALRAYTLGFVLPRFQRWIQTLGDSSHRMFNPARLEVRLPCDFIGTRAKIGVGFGFGSLAQEL